jgi:glucokinase
MTGGIDNLLLAGDIGGTKTILAVVSTQTGTAATLAEAVFENRNYAGLEEIVTDFLDRFGVRVSRASFSVAGPVTDGEAILSNLRWAIRAREFSERFGLESVDLVNDLQATAHAVPHLPTEFIFTIQPGNPRPLGPRAVIAPGTGLGQAFLAWTGSRFEAFPSEGGNADFAPANALQGEMLTFLQRRFGHVSYEMVCSGIGIPNIYSFLKETGRGVEPEWLADRLAQSVDPTPHIVDAALDTNPTPLCAQALQIFASILAAEAGNLALRLLPTGGVYIGGGIPPRILDIFQRDQFVEHFTSKGRFTDFMARFPLHVILEPRTALLGAAQFGLDLMHAKRPYTGPPAPEPGLARP